MLGHVAMILGADASVNAFIIYLYIDLIAKYTNIVRPTHSTPSDVQHLIATVLIQSDVKVDRDSVIARIARVFAVPASSLIWYGHRLIQLEESRSHVRITVI